MNDWKDVTSYSGGRRGNQEPQSWSLQLPWIILIVTRHVDYEPDQWLLNCHQLGLKMEEMRSKDIEAAKKEAVAFCTERRREYLKSLEGT